MTTTTTALILCIPLMVFVLTSYYYYFISTATVEDVVVVQCDMTFMRPSYVPIHLTREQTKYNEKYGLYEYQEIGSSSTFKENAIPVLFIPGQGGSYKQVRSMASHSAASSSFSESKFVFYSVDFNEEFSGMNGQTLQEQSEYVNDVVEYLCNSRKNIRLIIVGHSMGGIVGKLYLKDYYHSKLNVSLVTLSTPHTKPPFPLDSQLKAIYDELEISRNEKYYLLVSITGGYYDSMVSSELTYAGSPASPASSKNNIVSVYSSAVPRVWVNADHQCIVWCNQLVRVLVDLLQVIITTEESEEFTEINRMLREADFLWDNVEEAGKEVVIAEGRQSMYDSNSKKFVMFDYDSKSTNYFCSEKQQTVSCWNYTDYALLVPVNQLSKNKDEREVVKVYYFYSDYEKNLDSFYSTSKNYEVVSDPSSSDEKIYFDLPGFWPWYSLNLGDSLSDNVKRFGHLVTHFHSALIVYNVEFIMETSIDGSICSTSSHYDVVIRKVVRDTGEAEYYTNQYRIKTQFHPKAGFQPKQLEFQWFLVRKDFTNTKEPKDNCGGFVAVEFSIDWFASATMLLKYYSAAYLQFTFAASVWLIAKQMDFYYRSRQYISLSEAVCRHMKSGELMRIMVTLVVAGLFSDSILYSTSKASSTSLRLFDFEFSYFLAPYFWIVGLGVLMVFDNSFRAVFYILGSVRRRLLEFASSRPSSKPTSSGGIIGNSLKKTYKTKLVVIAVLISFTFLLLPQQFIYVVSLILLFLHCLESSFNSSSSLHHFHATLFTIGFILLPFNVPAIMVLIKNISVNWLPWKLSLSLESIPWLFYCTFFTDSIPVIATKSSLMTIRTIALLSLVIISLDYSFRLCWIWELLIVALAFHYSKSDEKKL